MIIFAGIDGTGPLSDVEYAKEFRTSFVNKLYQRHAWNAKYYQRGPSGDGFSTGTRALFMANFVRTRYYVGTNDAFAGYLRQNPEQRIPDNPRTHSERPAVFLCGYSRGGAAAIQAAWHLHEHKIQVDCLILYDAVDRTNTITQTSIPPNVSSCYHAIRNPATMSRPGFGNCGRTSTPATNYVERTFFCTHGGVGGLPWEASNAAGAIDETFGGTTNVTPTTDKLVSQKVFEWMTGHVNSEIRKYTRKSLQQAVVRGHSPQMSEY